MIKNKLIKLDKRDKEILFYLDLDARATYSEIAKKLKISKQAVKYRIDQLIEKGIIENTLLFVNGTKLGYVAYKFYIRFRNILEKRLKEILKELIEDHRIIWVATCDGKYDLAIAPAARNNIHAYKLLNELLIKYPEEIKDITPLNYIDVTHLKKVHLVDKKRDRIDSPYWGNEPKNYRLDDYEIKILSILCENARMPLTEIAGKIGTTIDIVKNRIKKLLNDKIIVGSTVILNKSILNYEYHKILLKTRFYSEKEEQVFLNFVRSQKNIVDVVRMMGAWDFELDLEIKNTYEFHEIMLKIRNEFPRNIQEYDSLIILKEYKLNFFPMKEKFKEFISEN